MSSNPTEGDLHFFSFTRISFKTSHGFAWFLKSKTIYIHRTYIHTSIIYVTKKVIHWGANHPTAAATWTLNYILQHKEQMIIRTTIQIFSQFFNKPNLSLKIHIRFKFFGFTPRVNFSPGLQISLLSKYNIFSTSSFLNSFNFKSGKLRLDGKIEI